MADTYSSTYRDVVLALQGIILSHPLVKTFRIGPFSSVEMPDTVLPEVTYPYVHLIPQPAMINKQSTLFDFDMIIMDLVDQSQLELQIRAQSQMLEITKDIISKYVMTDWGSVRYNIILPVTSTPFTERFLNDVSGWTTQISIEALTPMGLCNNPIG